jgi:hypothetical protein
MISSGSPDGCPSELAEVTLKNIPFTSIVTATDATTAAPTPANTI